MANPLVGPKDPAVLFLTKQLCPGLGWAEGLKAEGQGTLKKVTRV